MRLFRGSELAWRPENEASLEDALDHLAFSHFKVLHYEYTLINGEKIASHVTLYNCIGSLHEQYKHAEFFHIMDNVGKGFSMSFQIEYLGFHRQQMSL